MKLKSGVIIGWLAVLAFVTLAGMIGFTVIPGIQPTPVEFDAAKWVQENWEDRVAKPYGETADLSAILSKMQPDANGNAAKDNLIEVTEEYGLITVGESHVYKVNGSGKIVAADLETSKAIIEVALDGYSGPIKVSIYIGTGVAAADIYAVRDSVGLLLGDFGNQVPFNNAAAEINKHIFAEVLGVIGKENLTGKTVDFKGAFSISTFNQTAIDLKEIRIVPVEIEVVE